MKSVATIIHVNQHVLRANLKARADNPMLTCKRARNNVYAHEATIKGPSRFVNGMHKPLSCGARIWLRTEADVEHHTFEAKDQRNQSAISTIIRVDSKAIRNNLKHGTNLPVLTVHRDGVAVRAHEILIHGPATVKTSNLSIEHEGRIWVETTSDITVLAEDDATRDDARDPEETAPCGI